MSCSYLAADGWWHVEIFLFGFGQVEFIGHTRDMALNKAKCAGYLV
jgi:hypothetical protein